MSLPQYSGEQKYKMEFQEKHQGFIEGMLIIPCLHCFVDQAKSPAPCNCPGPPFCLEAART